MAKVDLNRVLYALRQQIPGAPTETEHAFASAFLEVWPGSEAKLEKYRKHPNCSTCRRDLLELLSPDPKKLGKFISQAPDLPELPAKKGAVPYSAVGQCADLPDTPEAYTEFLRSIESAGGRYKGVYVRDLGAGSVRVYVY